MTWAGGAPFAAGGPVTSYPSGGPNARVSTVRRVLSITMMLIGFGVGAVVLAETIGASEGVVATLIGLVCAMIPVGVVVPAFLWLDRFEIEPKRLLLFAAEWGALVASVIALVLNGISVSVLRTLDNNTPLTTEAVMVAPFVEETAKGLGVLAIVLFRRREFDGIVDGLVYAGITAAGFAFAENILYLSQAFHDGGGWAVAQLFVLRCVVSPFAHPLFTICTGVGLGLAVTARSSRLRVVAPPLGWLCAVALHSLWNATVGTSNQGFVSTYLVLQVPIFAAFATMAVLARRHEGRLIGTYLAGYARAGWLTPQEVAMLASLSHRALARRTARSHGGRAALAAMDRFQDAGSDLALLRRRIEAGTAGADAAAHEQELLQILTERRRELAGRC